MSNSTAKTLKQDAIEKLWRRGVLSFKLHSSQKQLYEHFYNSEQKVQVWLISRRYGKSFALCVLALEQCIRKPNSIVKFLSPTKIQVNNNVRPLFRKILEDCPEDVRPDFNNKDYIYYFPNGSEIQLAGSEGGHAEKLRGGDSHLAFIDEAGSCSDLDNTVKSILIPTTLMTKGKIILCGTPSREMDHEFKDFIEEAELKGSLTKKTIYDNPLLTAKEIEDAFAEYGGKESEESRREYLCVDENTLIKTNTGYKKIKEITLGEQVLTHKGRYKPVLNVFQNPLQDRKVFSVYSSNNLGVTCTEGHQLFISTQSKKTKKFIDEWLKVENIKLSKNRTKRTYFKVPIDITELKSNEYNEDLAYLIGWHLAEGHLSKNAAHLSLNYNDPIDKINELAIKLWGKPYKLSSKHQGCNQYTLCSKKINNFLMNFGQGAKNKFIPQNLKTARNSIKISLLKALFSGDGYYNLESYRAGLTSISLKLITATSDILNSLNIPHQIGKIRNAGESYILGRKVNVQDTFVIKIFGKNFEKFMDVVFNTNVEKKSRSGRNFIKDGFLYSRIHRINQIEYKKPIVYDIEVEEDHSYVGLHAVFHNCEIIRDPKTSVIPEFTKDLENEIVKEWPRPPHFDVYEGMDLGGKDLTVNLLAYYDFRNNKVVIEDEIVVDFKEKNVTIETLITKIKEKEEKHFFNYLTNEQTKPTKRVSDIDYIVVNEINKTSRKIGADITFEMVKKDNLDAMVNFIREKLKKKEIIINPRCQTLIRHLRNIKWKKGEKSIFARSPDDGHYDAVAALMYLIRAVDYRKNPYPAGYGLSQRDLFGNIILAKEQRKETSAIEIAKKIFNIKGKQNDRR